MQRETSSRISVLLLDTLRQVERTSDGSRDDPAVAGLERYVHRLVKEMEALKRPEIPSPASSPMPASPSAKIVEILQNALEQVDRLSADDADTGELKSNLTRAIAELEVSESVRVPLLADDPPQTEAAGAATAQPQPGERCREPQPADVAPSLPPGQFLPEAEEENRSAHGKAGRKSPASRRQNEELPGASKASKSCSADRG